MKRVILCLNSIIKFVKQLSFKLLILEKDGGDRRNFALSLFFVAIAILGSREKSEKIQQDKFLDDFYGKVAGSLSSMPALVARSVMLLVKSVILAIAPPINEAAVNRAINRI